MLVHVAVLAAFTRGALAQVAAWDCNNFPHPVQILRASSDMFYRTMQLNIAAGRYEEMWQWTEQRSEEQPTRTMNAQAYNVNDGIAYGLFSPNRSTARGASYLCRFSHENASHENASACLCSEPSSGGDRDGDTIGSGDAGSGDVGSGDISSGDVGSGDRQSHEWISGAITRDGTYYLMSYDGRIKKLPSTHLIAYPPSSPAPYSSLGDCGMLQILSGKSISPVDVSRSGLRTVDMEAAYDDASSCTSQCYMEVWSKSASRMTSWRPHDQSFADIIDFEYGNTTYLLGLGSKDGSALIVKLDGDGGGDVAGFAYSRVVVNYTRAGTSISMRTMDGFGAAYRYGSRLYFSSNIGSGIFELDNASLTEVLDRTGADACDFRGSHVCSRLPMHSPAPAAITLKWVAAAVDATRSNDGFNCYGAADPFDAATGDQTEATAADPFDLRWLLLLLLLPCCCCCSCMCCICCGGDDDDGDGDDGDSDDGDDGDGDGDGDGSGDGKGIGGSGDGDGSGDGKGIGGSGDGSGDGGKMRRWRSRRRWRWWRRWKRRWRRRWRRWRRWWRRWRFWKRWQQSTRVAPKVPAPPKDPGPPIKLPRQIQLSGRIEFVAAHSGAQSQKVAFLRPAEAIAICVKAADAYVTILDEAPRPTPKLYVEGHTSSEPNGRADSVRLSKARAELCAKQIRKRLRELRPGYLASLKIRNQVVSLGFGASRPLIGSVGDKHTENRRVEVHLRMRALELGPKVAPTPNAAPQSPRKTAWAD